MSNFSLLLLTNDDTQKAVAIHASMIESFHDRLECTLLNDDILTIKNDIKNDCWVLPSDETFAYARIYNDNLLDSLKEEYELIVL